MNNGRRDVIKKGLASTAGAAIAARMTPAASALAQHASSCTKVTHATVLVVGSNARVLQLRGGRTFATGNYLNETVVPMQALRAAGYELLVATPDGTRPVLDQRSIAASHFRGDKRDLRAAIEFFERDPSMRNVRSLRTVVDAGLQNIAGIFVPGGHAPITDLVTNAELGELLRDAHIHSKPTALICHGPIAILAAMARARTFEQAMIVGDRARAREAAQDWPYRGYRMTIFSNREERLVEAQVFGSPLMYSVADALQIAGGGVEHGPVDYEPFVVVDRELITGQNPRSDHLLAAKLIEALDARRQEASADGSGASKRAQ